MSRKTRAGQKPCTVAGAGSGRRRSGAVRARPYERRLARQAATENVLAVLPAGPGRRVVTLAATEYLKTVSADDPKPVLVVVPNPRMVGEYMSLLRSATNTVTVTGIDGRVPVCKREGMWRSDIVCATSRMLLSGLQRVEAAPDGGQAELPDPFIRSAADLMRETPSAAPLRRAAAELRRRVASLDRPRPTVRPDQFGLVVFVGAARAVGSHSYARAAGKLSGDTRILAVADALPGRAGKAAEMAKNLRIASVGGRPEYGPGVPARRGKPAVEWVAVDLSPEIAAAGDCLERALREACAPLRDEGYGDLEDPPLARLEGVFAAARRQGGPARAARKAVFARHLLDALEAYGPAAFLYLCGWCRSRPGIDRWLDRPLLAEAAGVARAAWAGGTAHPKMARLTGMLAAEQGRTLVVAGPDGSVEDILWHLQGARIPATPLPPGPGVAGQVRTARTEAVAGLRTGRYDVLVSERMEDAYAGAGDGCLGPGDVDLVVFCAGDPDTARSAARCPAARVVVLVTRGSAEDPAARAAVQLDWMAAKALEDNRRPEAPEWDGAGLAARDEGRPEYQLLRHKGADAVLGPAGAAGTFVGAAGPGGTVRALLGRSVGRKGGRMYYVAHDSRPAEAESRRVATWGEKASAYAQLKKLDSGRNVDGLPTDKFEMLLKGDITVEDYRAIMRALRRALRTTIPPKDRLRNRVAYLAHAGIRGNDGRRLALYATDDGRLFNGLADGDCPEGCRKIKEYVLLVELPGRPKISTIRKYVESVVVAVMAEIGDRPEFAEQAGRRP